ncbi:MAG TPA: glycosyltransferase, partial [Acidimicrobiales bacterium]
PRAVVTGNPVRPEMAAVDPSPAGRAAARAALGLPDGRRVLAVFGGSLGARRINEAALALGEAWRDRGDVAIRHAVGSRDWPDVEGRLPDPPPGGLVYQAVEYEERMPDVFAAADLVVCRAGASTLAELTVVGVPSVLVPLPIASEDHQTVGARVLADAGAAVWVPDADLGAERLAAEAEALLADDARLAAMAEAARRLGRPDAAARVAALVEEHARA